ncbi:disks large-associated protein 5 isoform X2 [Pseudorasbora parva]|uniref:disks large-associated protein 5 isoform X2 n=1 Tax=Pseudorasbora parva TaxID=51549 RepID=UPI00351DFBAD
MDSRFAHLYKRDSSVSMIRLKMSRRRSQSQKENREKIQNLHRHLDQLPEIELSMDASSIIATQDKAPKTKTANDANTAAEERKKMLARYKENKMLQKEKEKREKEKKGVFKVSLYKPQPLGYLPSNTAVPGRGKITETNQSTRVTRSMMQNQKPSVERHAVPKKVETVSTTRAPTKSNSKALTSTKTRATTAEPSMRAPTTRSAAKTTLVAVVKPVTDSRATKTRSTVKCPAAPSSGRGKTVQGNTKTNIENKPAEKEVAAVNPVVPEEEKPKAAPPSFAPQGFVFQPPAGLSSFEPAPLSPRSTTAFLSPSFLSEASVEPTFPSPPKSVHPAPSLSLSPSLSTPPPDLPTRPPSVSSPPPAPSSPQPSTSAAPSVPFAPLEPQHDVAYFRAVMVSETERLTVLSELWESRFDDTSIPEEMRDRMRTAVGQARLLMKERFGQFSGLVDDCDLGRGDKITTCTDLQGFWDMVYFQVEDVTKKFNDLKEAEAKDWKEEDRPVARKRVAKKPPAIGGKAEAGGGASAAAKSRLAAVKAAMRAKQAEQKAAESSGNIQEEAGSVPAAPAATLPAQTVVFHGGFFQVESPVKPSGAVRRSCRISTVSSPCGSKFSTPGRQRRSNAASHSSSLPCVSATPPRNHHHDVLSVSTPLCSAEPLPHSPRAPQISPDHNKSAHVWLHTNSCSNSQPHDLSSTCTSHTQEDICNEPENSPVDQSHDLPRQSEHLANSSEPQVEESVPESMLSPSSQEEPQEDMVSDDSLPAPTGADAGLDTLAQCSSHTSFSEAVEAEPTVYTPASPILMPSTPTKDLSISTALSNEVISACNGSPISTDVEMTGNEDAEDATDLDFERYLQPAVRDSMSPGLAAERFSLGVVDAEMESPVTPAEECPLDFLATPTDVGQSAAVHPRAEGESETVSV